MAEVPKGEEIVKEIQNLFVSHENFIEIEIVPWQPCLKLWNVRRLSKKPNKMKL